MDYDYKAITAKVEKQCTREMRAIDKEYQSLTGGMLAHSAMNVEDMNSTEAYNLGYYRAYSDILAIIENAKAKEDREVNRTERRKVRVFGQ